MYRGRALRRLYTGKVIGKRLFGMERGKFNHYQAHFVEPSPQTTTVLVPFALTAGGGVGEMAQEFLNRCLEDSSREISGQASFRNFLRSRLSILLLKRAHFCIIRCGRARTY